MLQCYVCLVIFATHVYMYIVNCKLQGTCTANCKGVYMYATGKCTVHLANLTFPDETE